MLDHIAIEVKDYEKSKQFYITILEPLGYGLVMEVKEKSYAGFGRDGKPSFWLHKGKKIQPGVHIAFQAASRKKVDEFYEVAIKAGALDNGKPGIREHYHPNYYGAFVLDLEGHNIEAVCHKSAEE